jgi:hypothetical protein
MTCCHSCVFCLHIVDALSERCLLVAKDMYFLMKRMLFGAGGKRLGLETRVFGLQCFVSLEKGRKVLDVLRKRLGSFQVSYMKSTYGCDFPVLLRI